MTVSRPGPKARPGNTSDAANRVPASGDGSANRGGGGSGGGSPSVAAQLMQIARQRYRFGVSDLDEPFALPKAGPQVVAMLRGGKRSLRALLAREYEKRTRRVATQQALTDTLMVLEGIAQDTDPRPLHVRAAQHDGSVWLDLGDKTGRAVRITAGGWRLAQPPVLFKRTALTGALPEPARDGKLDELWSWLNVDEADRPLVAAAMVAALFSEQAHVVLSLLGEYGTAKTTAAKVIVALLDPSPVPVRKPPRDAEAWVTAAAASWVVCYDNLSAIPPWLSDTMCRASTGEGDVRRKLYSDGDLAVFAFRRFVIFTAIDPGALAPDLADRNLRIVLPVIADKDRRDEEQMWAQWPAAYPRLLGALLDLAAAVMARLPATWPERKPRMADFGRVLAAVDAELRTAGFARYSEQAAGLAAEGLAGDPFARQIQAAITGSFEGTSAALLAGVTPTEPEWKPPRDWPASARTVTGKMRHLAPAFRKLGWTVRELPPGHENAIRWALDPPPEGEKSREDAREHSQPRTWGGSREEASERERPGGPSMSGPGASASGPREGTREETREGYCNRCHDSPAGPGGVLCTDCRLALAARQSTGGDMEHR